MSEAPPHPRRLSRRSEAMILVTGATGNVGQEVVRVLAARRMPFRRGLRPGASAATERAPSDVVLDFTDAATFFPAVQGCRGVFLLRPPAISDTRSTLNAFIDVARVQGVAQIVFVSVAGAADNRLVPHHAVEQHLLAGPPGWTILRPGFFAQNLGDAYRDDIRLDHRLYLPAGQGRVAFIDVRDLAEVAADALCQPQLHWTQSYTLTGPEANSFAEAATMLSAVLERPICYQPASLPGYVRHLRRRGLVWPQVLVQTVLHVGLRFGQAETVDPTLARLLGRRPGELRDYIGDHRELWL